MIEGEGLGAHPALASTIMSKGCSVPAGVFPPYERHGTRLCAHALNPTMHRTSVAKTATLNSASIMAPSTESTLEGLSCPAREIFPVASNASDDHHSLAAFDWRPRKDAGQKRGDYNLSKAASILVRIDLGMLCATAAIIRITHPAKSTTIRRPSPPRIGSHWSA
jgi:hypothetical protein